MRALAYVVVMTFAIGCKSKDKAEQKPAPTPGTASAPIDAAAVDAGSATAAPAPIGTGPCVGTWSVELESWNKSKQKCPMNDEEMVVARKYFIVRDPSGKGYGVRSPEGMQSLGIETKTDSEKACTIVVTELFSHRTFSSSLVYTLAVDGEQVTATGSYSEEDHGEETPSTCERTFKVKATRGPLAPADLAFDPAQAAKEFAALWDGDRALTLKEFCEELPAMKTQRPRTAKVTLTISESGALEKLVIDGVDQGKLDERCMFPMALEEAEPIGFSNRSGVTQTVTFDAQLN